ncbi:hypothetical protein GCM10029964_058370 [Kibdelosporangium lantanae]
MILTVTLNAALDTTYHVENHTPGHTHRVHTVHTRPGGKGVNVHDVLRQLGEPVRATGLASPDIDLPDFVPINNPTRRTTTILTPDGTATLFNEPGPHVSAGSGPRSSTTTTPSPTTRPSSSCQAASHPASPPTPTPTSSPAPQRPSSSTPTATHSATASPPTPR